MVSIIIPVKDNFKLTKACLDALFENTTGVDYEVVVVDNGSTDETNSYFKNLKEPRVRYIRLPENLGFSKACNIGARASKGDILIFLNNDTEVQENWLLPIVKEIEKDKRTIAGSRLIFPDKKIQHAGIVITERGRAYHIYRNYPMDFYGVLKKRRFIAVTGACLGVSKERFFELGMFCEDYINGYEDLDLCLENEKRGGINIYIPESVVIHLESKTPGRFKENKHNILTLFRRKGSLKPNISKYFIEDGVLDRYVVDPEGEILLVTYAFADHSKPLLRGLSFLKNWRLKELKEVVPELKDCFRPEAFFLRGIHTLLTLEKVPKDLISFYITEPCYINRKLFMAIGLWNQRLRRCKDLLIVGGRRGKLEYFLRKLESSSSVEEKLYYLEKIRHFDHIFYLQKSYEILGDTDEFLVRKLYLEVRLMLIKIFSTVSQQFPSSH